MLVLANLVSLSTAKLRGQARNRINVDVEQAEFGVPIMPNEHRTAEVEVDVTEVSTRKV